MCVCKYPTLNVLFDWSLAIIENDWFQMRVTEVSCTATCMATNGCCWTRCRPFSIIIAPNRTTRRKELRFIKASASKMIEVWWVSSISIEFTFNIDFIRFYYSIAYTTFAWNNKFCTEMWYELTRYLSFSLKMDSIRFKQKSVIEISKWHKNHQKNKHENEMGDWNLK